MAPNKASDSTPSHQYYMHIAAGLSTISAKKGELEPYQCGCGNGLFLENLGSVRSRLFSKMWGGVLSASIPPIDPSVSLE